MFSPKYKIGDHITGVYFYAPAVITKVYTDKDYYHYSFLEKFQFVSLGIEYLEEVSKLLTPLEKALR